MKQNWKPTLLGAGLLILSACQQLLQPQSWSQNYARLEGTAATSAAMIDGDHETSGLAKVVNRGTSEITIILPAKKRISKVAIVSKQLSDPKFKGKRCNLYTMKQGDWNLVAPFSIQGFRTEVRFPAVEIDQIRIQVPSRLSFREMGRIVNRYGDIHNQKYYDPTAPTIEEIELYGPIETVFTEPMVE